MQPVLLDTSVYISVLRQEAFEGIRDLVAGSTLWLSSLVLEELYAGAGKSGRHIVERMEREFDSVKRILVPNLKDWTVAGKTLAQLGEQYGYEPIGRGRLTNDALIAISAGRLGITLLTANERNFRRLAEFHEFRWRVILA